MFESLFKKLNKNNKDAVKASMNRKPKKQVKKVEDTVVNPMEGSICLLDMGITSISIINKMRERFPNERITFINDLEYGEYEGHDAMDIKSRIKKIVEEISKNKPKLLVILNSVFVEYGEDVFENLDFPVINIIKTIVEYVNTNHEFKSILFIANDGIVEANLYQKALHYNHLYNRKANFLIDLANAKMMKTKESFEAIGRIAEEWSKRDVEIIVTPELNLLLFYTEFNEYFKGVDLIPTDEAVLNQIEEELKKLAESGKQNQVTQKSAYDVYLYMDVEDKYKEEGAFRKLLKEEIEYGFRSYSIKK